MNSDVHNDVKVMLLLWFKAINYQINYYYQGGALRKKLYFATSSKSASRNSIVRNFYRWNSLNSIWWYCVLVNQLWKSIGLEGVPCREVIWVCTTLTEKARLGWRISREVVLIVQSFVEVVQLKIALAELSSEVNRELPSAETKSTNFCK